MANNPLHVVQQSLVCPLCKGTLAVSDARLACTACRQEYPQTEDGWLDLLPRHVLSDERNRWITRQLEMEGWYQDLLTDPAAASACLLHDYEPYAARFADLSGVILDLGGGIGLVRHYLATETEYVVVDPSLTWHDHAWTVLAEQFPCLERKPLFIRGIGEYLPFPEQAFDVVLALWSLNHVSDPKQVFAEVARVLRPGGCFIVVLEEMLPRWSDLFSRTFPARAYYEGFFRSNQYLSERRARLRLLKRFLRREEWPLQSDHLRIRESDLRKWTSMPFKVSQRTWVNHYLTFELIRVGSR